MLIRSLNLYQFINKANQFLIWLLSTVFLVLYAPTVFSNPLPPEPFGDSGIYFTIFLQLTRGLKLYVDLYDHKDFLYFYGYGVAFKLFGLYGPMAWEMLLSLLMLACLIDIAKRLTLHVVYQVLVCLIFIIFYYSDRIYHPMQTFHQGMFFYALAICSALRAKPIVTGSLLTAMIFSKMPLMTLFPSVVWVSLATALDSKKVKSIFQSDGFHHIFRLFVGFLLTTILFTIILATRGELSDYVFDVIPYNFIYSSTMRATYYAGFRDSVTATVGWLFINHIFLACSIAAWFIFKRLFVLGVNTRLNDLYHPVTILLIGAASVFTVYVIHGLPHHFYFLGFTYALMVALTISLLKKTAWQPKVVAAIAWLAIIIPLVGQPTLLNKPRTFDVATWMRNINAPISILDPEMRSCIDRLELTTEAANVVTLNQHISYLVGGVLPESMHLSCRYIFQAPWFTPNQQNEIYNCVISPNTDLVFRRPFPLSMPVFDQTVDQILLQQYNQVGMCQTKPPTTVWLRK